MNMNHTQVTPNTYSADVDMDSRFRDLLESMNRNMARNSALDSRQSDSPLKGSNTEMKPLMDSFLPGDDDVICGRGKKCYNHIGNQRFRKIVESRLDQYSAANSRHDKSEILSAIVTEVRQLSPKGGFVKQDASGSWYEVGDYLAREKTSQAFRDALHEHYRSSKKAKHEKRRQKGKNKEKQAATALQQMSVELFYKSASRALAASNSAILDQQSQQQNQCMSSSSEKNNLSFSNSEPVRACSAETFDRMNQSFPRCSYTSGRSRSDSFRRTSVVGGRPQNLDPLPITNISVPERIQSGQGELSLESNWAADPMDCDDPMTVKQEEDCITLKDLQDWHNVQLSEAIDPSSTGSGIIARLTRSCNFREDDNPFEPIPIAEPGDMDEDVFPHW